MRNLFAGQEAPVRIRHGRKTGSKSGKEHIKSVYCYLLTNLYAEYIMQNAGLDKDKLESELLGEISITSDMQMTPLLWQKVKN